MAILKIKTTIQCDTCGCDMKRTKSIPVLATTKEGAITEAKEKSAKWQSSLKGVNCRCCQSILNSVGR